MQAVPVARRSRADIVISVRLSRAEVARLQEAARRAGTTLSRTAREAITGRCPAAPMPWTIGSVSGGPVYLRLKDGDAMGAWTVGQGAAATWGG